MTYTTDMRGMNFSGVSWYKMNPDIREELEKLAGDYLNASRNGGYREEVARWIEGIDNDELIDYAISLGGELDRYRQDTLPGAIRRQLGVAWELEVVKAELLKRLGG